jgi:hypothetical protein
MCSTCGRLREVGSPAASAREIVCVECGARSNDGAGWKADLVTDDERVDEDECALWCSGCCRLTQVRQAPEPLASPSAPASTNAIRSASAAAHRRFQVHHRVPQVRVRRADGVAARGRAVQPRSIAARIHGVGRRSVSRGAGLCGPREADRAECDDRLRHNGRGRPVGNKPMDAGSRPPRLGHAASAAIGVLPASPSRLGLSSRSTKRPYGNRPRVDRRG